MKQLKLIIKIIRLLVLIYIALCQNLKAQEYFPFPQDSAIWYSLNIWPYHDPPPIHEYHTYLEFIRDDTIINEHSYKKYFVSLYEDPIWQNDYWGAIRVDVTNEKVYFVYWESDHETLIYDFNLVPGDTIEVETLYGLNHLTCLDTATLIIDNLPHPVFHIYNIEMDYFMTWVKGIGSLRLPHETSTLEGYGFEHQFILTCFYYKGDHIYQWIENPFFEGCEGHYIAGINEEKESSNIQIVPNPVTFKSKVITNGIHNQLCNYLIMNISGMVLTQKQNIPVSNILIEKKHYTPGIYILKIYLIEDTIYVIKKIIIY